MIVSEQPGRVFAVVFFAPYLRAKGKKYNDKLLGLFGNMFFFYELFWLVFYKPKVVNFGAANKQN
jgi:hypothetical protein